MLHGSTILFGLICLGGAAGYVFASSSAVHTEGSILTKTLTKGIASTSFVALALINGAASTLYGRTILAALVLSWIGDMLLLSRRSIYLLSGMTTFLIAHLGFTVAFATREVSVMGFVSGLVITGILAALIFRWLWKHLAGVFVIAVPIYLAAVMVMVSAAVAVSAASLSLTVALAAVLFAASDVSVARDRFVEHDVRNKAWGLPLYYLAQILFATSVSVAG